MKKVSNLIKFVFCILLFAVGCNKQNVMEKRNTIHFDTSNWDNDQIIPKKIIKRIKFIPLETTTDCLIGSIGKIRIDENLLYIKDNKFVKKILIFNNKGKYLRSIGKYGKGAGEFINLTDFIVDKKQNRLLVLDNQQRKVLSYDLNNGDYLDEMKIDFWATNFEKIEDNVLCFYSKDQNVKVGYKHSIANLYLKDNSLKWFLKQDEYDTNLSNYHSLFQSENTYFTPYFKDIVYRITKDKVEPFITLNFGQNKIPEKRFKSRSNLKEIIKVIEEKDWSYSIENVIENKQFLTFNFMCKKKPVLVIYSKESGNYFYGKCYEGALSFFRLINNIAICDDQFLGVIDAFLFKKMEKMNLEQNDEELTSYYLQTTRLLSDESNPVVISVEYNTF